MRLYVMFERITKMQRTNTVSLTLGTPGMVMAIYGLLSKNKTPSQEDVEQFCQGNICRCTGYANIYKRSISRFPQLLKFERIYKDLKGKLLK